jgi:Tol biopolymer transport system component
MAPEQLEGQSADTRTDIFAFGTVVYEMATGKKAFTGKSQASLIGSILKDDPPAISTIQPLTPPALDRVVKTCLAKDPDDRWQTAHDLAQELKWISEGGSEAAIATVPSGRSRTRERAGWIAAGLFLTAALILAVLYVLKPAPAEPPVMRFNISPPEKTRFAEAVALSPDGRMIAFNASESDGKKRLWIRQLDGLASRVLAGTEAAEFPFWSPDSRFIGFFAENKLKKIDVSGAPPQTLCEVTGQARGGTWNGDGTIIFTPNFTTPLYKVSANGGNPVPVTEFDASRKETSHRWPCFLPDGRHFVYYARTAGVEGEGIVIGSLDSDKRQFLFAGESGAILAPGNPKSGGATYLLFVRDDTLMAQRFDLSDFRLTGEPHRIADDLAVYGESGPTGYAAFSVSDDGVLAYRTGSGSDVQFVWVNRENKQLDPVGVPPGRYSEPWLSLDEKRVVFGRSDEQAHSDIWQLDLSRGTTTRLTFAPSQENCPLLSPDGSLIVFTSERNGKSHLYQKSSSGTGAEELLLDSNHQLYADDWSRDGKYLLVESKSETSTFDLWVLPMVGERKAYPLIQTEFNDTHSSFSPDGRWVAYVSDESGRAEVYVRSFAGSGGKWQVSTGGGDQPAWRSDGEELFYISSERRLMSVSIARGASFEAGIPTALFDLFINSEPLTGDRNQYVVADRGRRFLVCSLTDRERDRPMTVVSDWMSMLKDKP